MDGRVQLPVIEWIKSNYPVDFVDVITEAGMDRVLSSQEDISEIQRSINVSVNVNKSTKLFVVGHYDCRGNPAPDTVQHQQIGISVKRLKELWTGHEIVGLWVNSNWQVEVIPSAV